MKVEVDAEEWRQMQELSSRLYALTHPPVGGLTTTSVFASGNGFPGIGPIAVVQNPYQRSGCRSEGWCAKCQAVVGDPTCFCMGICPWCQNWCPEIPGTLDGIARVKKRYFDGYAFFRGGKWVRNYEIT